MADTREGQRILHYGHAVLRSKAAPVPKINAEVERVAERLRVLLDRAGGLGLAAPQIGCGLCVISYDVGDGPGIVVNPQIVKRQGTDSSVEGCLSLPRLFGDVPRAAAVVVKGRDLRGREVTIEAQDLFARVLQHEIDHLDGVLFIDRVEPATLHWFIEDARGGEAQRVPTTLENALKLFEARLAAGDASAAAD